MYRTWMMVMVASLAGSAFALEWIGPEIVTRGEVVAVSIEASTVTIEEAADPSVELSPDAMQSGVRRDFLVNDATTLTANDESIELGDIAVGSNVVVRYVMDDGTNLALEIEVRSPATE